MFMVLRAGAYKADFYERYEDCKRFKNVYEVQTNERVVLDLHGVSQDEVNIVAYAVIDGSRNYPTRWNRIETGEHLKPFGPRGGLRGCVAVVVRDEVE